jgi:Holliday junction resolvase RusA-like endonuclease
MSRNVRQSDIARLEAMGATTRGINLRVLLGDAPTPVAVLEAEPIADRPARLVVGFVVEARPVPWKVSIHKGGYATNPKFVEWCDEVAKQARAAMGSAAPWPGPFESRMAFYLRRRGSMPDLGNLVKGTLDALQGIVIVDDEMQRAERNSYVPGSPEDRSLIEVWTVAD